MFFDIGFVQVFISLKFGLFVWYSKMGCGGSTITCESHSACIHEKETASTCMLWCLCKADLIHAHGPFQEQNHLCQCVSTVTSVWQWFCYNFLLWSRCLRTHPSSYLKGSVMSKPPDTSCYRDRWHKEERHEDKKPKVVSSGHTVTH